MTSTSTVTSGTDGAAASARTAVDRRVEGVRRASPGRRPGAPPGRTRCSAACPALNTPTFAVTVGQRPFSAWMPWTSVGAGEDRAAALLGLDAGVRGAPVDRQPQVGDALARRDEVAVRPRALEDEAGVGRLRGLDDVRRRGRRADLLVRVGDERRCARTGHGVRRASSRSAAMRPQAARAARPSCRDTPGALRDRRRRSGTGAGRRSRRRRPCPCGRSAGGAGRRPGAPSNVPTTVSPNRPFGSGRRSTRAPSRSRSAATHVATSLTPCGE